MGIQEGPQGTPQATQEVARPQPLTQQQQKHTDRGGDRGEEMSAEEAKTSKERPEDKGPAEGRQPLPAHHIAHVGTPVGPKGNNQVPHEVPHPQHMIQQQHHHHRHHDTEGWGNHGEAIAAEDGKTSCKGDDVGGQPQEDGKPQDNEGRTGR